MTTEFAYLRRMLIAFLTSILLSGCGSSGSDFVFNGGSGSATQAATLRLESVLAQTVAADVDSFRVTGYDLAQNRLFGPQAKPKDTTVEFEAVPVSVKLVVVEYLRGDQVVGISQSEVTLSTDQVSTLSRLPIVETVAPVTSLQLNPPLPTLAPGTSTPFSLLGLSDNGANTNLTSIAIWSTSNPGVATVDSNGVVKATSAGSAEVKAVLGEFSAVQTLTVSKAELVSLRFLFQDNTLPVGISAVPVVEGFFSDGSFQDVSRDVTLSSSNSDVAEIGEGGLLMGASAGKTTLTATLGTLNASRNITLSTQSLPDSVINGPQRVIVGTSYSYGVSQPGRLGEYFFLPVSFLSRFETSNSGVLPVSPSTNLAFAYPKQAGTSTLSASFGPLSTALDVEVVSADNATLTVNPTTDHEFLPGTRHQLKAIATIGNGQEIDVTEGAVWSSDNSQVATVEKGRVSVRSAGTAVLTAIIPGDGRPTTAAFTLNARAGVPTDLVVSDDTHTFNTETGEYDGTRLSGWSPSDNTLTVSSLSIGNGATLTWQGAFPLKIKSSGNVDISGTLDGSGSDGQMGENGPGESGLNAQISALRFAVGGTIDVSGGDGLGDNNSGGDGGFVALSVLDGFSTTGSLNAHGGAGAPGFNPPASAGGQDAGPGGDGGSAGGFIVNAGSVSLAGSVQLNGGTPGNGGGEFRNGNNAGGDGGNGGAGGLLKLTTQTSGLTEVSSTLDLRGSSGAAGGEGNFGFGGRGGIGGRGGSFDVNVIGVFRLTGTITAQAGDGGQGGLSNINNAGKGGDAGIGGSLSVEAAGVDVAGAITFVGGNGGSGAKGFSGSSSGGRGGDGGTVIFTTNGTITAPDLDSSDVAAGSGDPDGTPGTIIPPVELN
jgi:Big-like domain-containing protein